jgi:uncharacterized membrane protein YagU involved in acid resistance
MLTMNQIVSGAIAGFTATVPMTAAMVEMHKHLPPHEQYPLPPRLITENALETIDAHDDLHEEDKTKLALGNHFAYGTAVGAIYAAGLKALGSKPTVANGVVFGLGLWAVSYQGFLPISGLFPPAHEQPARRNALMIAAHIVWGAALGSVLRGVNGNGTNR